MINKYGHIDSLGNLDQILFDHIMVTGIWTTAVTKQQYTICIGIFLLEAVAPIPTDVLAYKFRGVFACAQGYVVFVELNPGEPG